MNVKLIPNGQQLGILTRYYICMVVLMSSLAMTKSIGAAQVLDFIILDSPIYLAASTIVLLLWAWLYKYSKSIRTLEYILIISIPPITYTFCTWLSTNILDIMFYGQLILFSLISYIFSYIEYYKQHAMLPIHNTVLLDALTNKLKPHFLFNSINTILGVIRNDTKLAEQLLEDLSAIFRCFAGETKYAYSFQEDLDLALKYVDVENIRTGNDINFIQDIDPMTMHNKVPFLLLQPLLENSIHYGYISKKQDGYIKLTSSYLNNFLVISIENRINPNIREKGTGTTISNLRNRLAIMYDVTHVFEISTVHNIFKLTIKIPNTNHDN